LQSCPDYKQYKLYLASLSPRRKELLAQLGFQFDVVSVNIDETPLFNESAKKYVARLAVGKASAGLLQIDNDGASPVVIGADTSVVLDGDIMGKPESKAHAVDMLMRLSGREHSVLTGVAVLSNSKQNVQVNESIVRMCQITSAEAASYWHTGEPIGKAGGYAIQGLAAVYISHLAGSYSGVMGLPLFETNELLSPYFGYSK